MKQSRACDLAHSCVHDLGTRNPFALCAQLGILVRTEPVPRGVDGVLYRVGGRRVVLLSERLEEPDRRMACAHLLGHALLHETPRLLLYPEPDGAGAQETEARQFAQALLGSSDCP